MATKTYKPTSPGRRNYISIINPELSKERPEKSLVRSLNKTGGRNNLGRVTSRHIGGGHKRKYRVVDFKRDKVNIPARVAAIEYDPNRSANIALLFYADGEKRYILSPAGIKVLANSPLPWMWLSPTKTAESGVWLPLVLTDVDCTTSRSPAAITGLNPWETLCWERSPGRVCDPKPSVCSNFL